MTKSDRGYAAIAADLAARPHGELDLAWAAAHFWGVRLSRAMDAREGVYERAVELELVGSGSARAWGCDNRLWVEEHPAYRVLLHTTQSQNFLYAWEQGSQELRPREGRRGLRRLHCRLWWERFEDEEKDSDRREAAAGWLKAVRRRGGFEHAVRHAGELTRFADDGAQFPTRPSLEYYRSVGFAVGDKGVWHGGGGYGDARDPGYVFSWDEFTPRVDDAVHQHRYLEVITTCFIPDIEGELSPEGDRE